MFIVIEVPLDVSTLNCLVLAQEGLQSETRIHK